MLRPHDDSDCAPRAALTHAGLQARLAGADIGCGNGVAGLEAALMGAEVDAIDICRPMLALADIQGEGSQGRDQQTQPSWTAELRLPAEFA